MLVKLENIKLKEKLRRPVGKIFSCLNSNVEFSDRFILKYFLIYWKCDTKKEKCDHNMRKDWTHTHISCAKHNHFLTTDPFIQFTLWLENTNMLHFLKVF